MKRALGYASLLISTLLYLLIFALPFFELSTSHKLQIGTGLYIVSYITMFLGVALLGKEIMDAYKEKLKQLWQRFLRKRKSTTRPFKKDRQ